MENVIAIARELGYLNIPPEILVKITALNNYSPNEIVIITTGSQGEPLSALTRMSVGEHRQIVISKNDYVIISATPIPGNENAVSSVVNDLMELGAEVIYENMYDVHVSGHACQEELKLMIALTRPKFFIPIHGEFKHLHKNSELAEKMGISKDNIFLLDLGEQVETDGTIMSRSGEVTAAGVFIDGSGLGDVGDDVINERKKLGQNGVIMVSATISRAENAVLTGPEIMFCGCIDTSDVNEFNALLASIKSAVSVILIQSLNKNHDGQKIRAKIRQEVAGLLATEKKRSPKRTPTIFSSIMEVE
jgi:ribonuclease J